MNWFAHSSTPVATLVIAGVTVFVSIRAFSDSALRDRLIFNPQAILAGKEYHRLVTSALLHGGWDHLIFNMITVLLFGDQLEPILGPGRLLLIYCASIVGGSLLSLYLHRHHEYFALGASGGACGLVFASIFVYPGGRIGMFLIPFSIPSWLYAILFLLAEFHGVRSQRGNIGHDAHLGGAIVGLLTTTAMFPDIVKESPVLYAVVMGLSLAMFVYFWKNPMHLPWSSFVGSGHSDRIKDRNRSPTAAEIDAVLDKVARDGLQSLTAREQEILKAASKK